VSTPAADIRIRVDPTNPGQFFACCGLLECADKAYGGATGAFIALDGKYTFEIRTVARCSTVDVLSALSTCPISSTLTSDELSRLKVLLNKSKATLTAEEKAEKSKLCEAWNQERIFFGKPFDFWIDWWNDGYAGGSRLKTWAGKQLILELLVALRNSLRRKQWQANAASECLSERSVDGNLPLYFDADIGGHSSSIDVGFSLDALNMRASTRAVLELAAFVGLQRFRPRYSDDVLSYSLWSDPLPAIIASPAAAGVFATDATETYEFRIAFRSKYLKSFLPARKIIQHP
jgi:CRISPR-associated protein Csb3